MDNDQINITPESSWEDVQSLAPWYANNTLDVQTRSAIDNWLSSHKEQQKAWQDEIQWLQVCQEQLQSIATQNIPSPEQSLTKLHQKIAEHSQAGSLDVSDSKTGLMDWLQGLFDRYIVQQSGAWALGLFALCIGQMLLLQNKHITVSEQTILGAEQTSEQTTIAGDNYQVLTVAFVPTTSEQQIREQLNHAGANIVSGPSALGLYDIAVPKESALDIVSLWQSNTELFESVQEN